MPDTVALVEEEQRCSLDGFGEQILQLVSLENCLTDKVWGDWLRLPFERAAAYGEVELAILLHKAGAKGNGLIPAIRNGHRRVVSELLQYGAAPNARDDNGAAAIHIAAHLGHGPIVRTLLIEGAAKDEVNDRGFTPLHLASMGGHSEAVSALLAAGADVSIRMVGNSDYTALEVAAERGHVDVMKLLVEHRPASTAAGATNARTPLHVAAKQNQVPAIRYLLEEASTDIDAKDSDGYTALLLAAKECHAPAVDALCAAGADHTLDVTTYLCFDADHFNALGFASFYGDLPMMKTLLRSGADPNVRGWNNRTALHRAAEGNQADAIDLLVEAGASLAPGPDGFDGPVHAAVEGEGPEAVKALIRHGADPDWHGGGLETPLFAAVRRHLPHVVVALLAAGADPHIHGLEGTVLFTLFSPDSSSSWRVRLKILRALVAHGADPNVRNEDGDTPLHAAAEFHNGIDVDMLVKAGAKVDAERGGRTPFHCACDARKEDTMKVLLKHGADMNRPNAEGDTPLHLVASGYDNDRGAYELLNSMLIAGADETAMNKNGETPASHLPHELTEYAESDALRERLRALLLRAPADRADRWWRRRGALLLCQARLGPEESRAKMARVTETGGTHAAEFRGMAANLFELREGKEVIFRKIMKYL